MISNVDQNKVIAHNKSLFLKHAKACEKNFRIDDHNKEIIDLIILYISNHPDFLKTEMTPDPSLKKGLLLSGGVGTGKTLLLNILSRMKRFSVIDCRELYEKSISGGKKELFLYGRHSFKRGMNNHRDFQQPITRGFDDMGAEEVAVFYGNKIDTMGEIIQDRYPMYIKYGLMTHITTNLNGYEIEERYGPRVRSRMRQMFNQITVDGPERRK